MATPHENLLLTPVLGRGAKRAAAYGALLLLIALVAGSAGFAARAALEHRPQCGRAATSGRGSPGDGSSARYDERLRRPGRFRRFWPTPFSFPAIAIRSWAGTAPDFRLDDLDGKTWKLNDLLADGPVVVIFYHAYCDLCARQLFADERELPLFRAVGTRLVAISADPPAIARQRFARYGLFGFPVLWDPGNRVAEAYHVFRQGSRRGGDRPTPSRHIHHRFAWYGSLGQRRRRAVSLQSGANLEAGHAQGLLPAMSAKP